MRTKLLHFLFLLSFGGWLYAQENDTLTSSIYTVVINDTVGTISGFPYGTLLKDVIAGVDIPLNCVFSIINGSNGYQPLKVMNWDSLYVDVQVSENIYLVVIAENGINKIVYQLKPASSREDAFVISDFYTVDQTASLINGITDSTSIDSLFKYLTPAPGTIMMLINRYDHEYDQGFISLDDKLIVKSLDWWSSKTYYFQQLNCCTCPSNLLYAVSDIYLVNQINRFIYIDFTITTLVSDFLVHLSAPPYATIKVVNAQGIENTDTLTMGDKVEVTIDGQDCEINYRVVTLYNCSIAFSGYVLSDVYTIDQTNLTISCNSDPGDTTLVSDFLAHILPSPGASVKVLNAQGIENTGILAIGDKVEVTAVNYVGKVVYSIINLFNAENIIKNSSISIYPNPSAGNFNISGIPAGSKIVIRSILGRNIFETSASYDHLQLSLEGQPAGIYFILISNNTGLACYKLIVK